MRFFPLPMYTTVPNEGSTYRRHAGLHGPGRRRPGSGQVHHGAQPQLEQLGRRHGTVRYYRYFEPLHSSHLLCRRAPTINRSLWFTYDDDRRTPHALTLNVLVRVRRNLFYRYFGLGPDTLASGESSYTRLYATRARASGGT